MRLFAALSILLVSASFTPTGAAKGADPARVIGIVATDAPLLPHQCARLAQRVGMGVARMGSYASHGSGDLFCAFATGNRGLSYHVGEDDPREDLDRELKGWLDLKEGEQAASLMKAVLALANHGGGLSAATRRLAAV